MRPRVINNGVRIDFNDFIKSYHGQKSSHNLEYKGILYFEGDAAIALYGEEASSGLYLIAKE